MLSSTFQEAACFVPAFYIFQQRPLGLAGIDALFYVSARRQQEPEKGWETGWLTDTLLSVTWEFLGFSLFKKSVLFLKPFASAPSNNTNPPHLRLLHLHLPITPNTYFCISVRLFCEAALKALSKKLSLALWGFLSFITISTNYFHCFPTATIRGFNQSVTLCN